MRYVTLLFFSVQMLTVDLSICVSGLDRMDSAAVDGLQHDSVNQQEPSVIGQWEAELLQERLQELLHASPAEDDTMPVRTLLNFFKLI